MNENQLQISEKFYSLQCEGVSNGYPAYFIRLRGCNLCCGNPNLSNVKDRTNQKEIEANADPKATWVCDTIAVWLKGKGVTFEQIIEDWVQEHVLEYILSGRIHIIWTGGEPTMWDKKIVSFIDYVKEKFPESTPFYEIETNGSRLLSRELFNRLDQINCSPKLSNSAMPAEKRINGEALKMINEHKNSWFKFVVSNEENLMEAENDMIKPFNLDSRKIILMPGLSEQGNYFERTKFCYELAKENFYIGISRGHIAAWNKKTGV